MNTWACPTAHHVVPDAHLLHGQPGLAVHRLLKPSLEHTGKPCVEVSSVVSFEAQAYITLATGCLSQTSVALEPAAI
jgi:hypothetical protein